MTIYVQKKSDGPLGCEEKLIWQYATMERLAIRSLSPAELEQYIDLKESCDLAVGSVEFIRVALAHYNLSLPTPDYYPNCLHQHLHRDLKVTTAQVARWRIDQGETLFVKSVDWKLMTGTVCSSAHYTPELNMMNNDALVWIGNSVKWLSEFRVYVSQHQIIASCCYEGDEAFAIDYDVLTKAVDTLGKNNWHDTYVMDWGVMKTADGKQVTALVEMNDAWAIGAYPGISYKEYYALLTRRWNQLVTGGQR